ncbi:MAG TPA: SH3 domain-containing protein [Acidisarcina sp.]
MLLLLIVSGCNRIHHKPPADTVYVMAKQTFLRDKVAPVSNRVAAVQNGEKLTVLERGRRFLLVKTDKAETGWIEERAVVAPAIVTGFQELAKQHASDPVVATAVLRDDLYMHLQPGRDTDRFYLLPENSKLQLLVRASVPRVLPPQAASLTRATRPSQKQKGSLSPKGGPAPSSAARAPVARAAAPGLPNPGSSSASATPRAVNASPAQTLDEAPPMDDWWLTRDSQGRVGWLLARRMDVDVPDAIATYAEGQRMVGAYVLTRVADPDSNLPDRQVPVYVSVLSPFKDGLPYDFDQVRVFTWNLRKHRYETAYRQRNLQGYLPVTVGVQTFDKQGPVPTFAFKQGMGDAVVSDPQTGATRPAQTETETYRLDGVLVKKVVPAAAQANAPQSAATAAGSVGASRQGHRRARSRAVRKTRSGKNRRRS